MKLFFFYKIIYFITLTTVLSTFLFLGLFTYQDLYLSIDETAILVNLRSELAITEPIDLPKLAHIKLIIEKRIFVEPINIQPAKNSFATLPEEHQ